MKREPTSIPKQSVSMFQLHQTDDQLKQFDREQILVFFPANLGFSGLFRFGLVWFVSKQFVFLYRNGEFQFLIEPKQR